MYFFSREERRAHVHVQHADGEAKFWIHPNVELAVNFMAFEALIATG